MTFWIAIAAAALATQAPGWAESPPPALPASMQVTLDRYRYFTDCLAGGEWVTARPLFDLPIGSPEERVRLARIRGANGSGCLIADRMRLTSTLLRGGIAESRYRQVYRSDPVPPMSPEPAPVPEGASFQWVAFNRESPLGAQAAFANCLAEREPGAVHALLMTRIGRREERDAYQALSRRFGPCLSPGQRLRANSLTLRPWLAEALYQRARARRPDTGE